MCQLQKTKTKLKHKLTIQTNEINVTSTLPEVDVNIDRCNISMKLPKNIVGIKLPSKKNKSKLDDTDEFKKYKITH